MLLMSLSSEDAIFTRTVATPGNAIAISIVAFCTTIRRVARLRYRRRLCDHRRFHRHPRSQRRLCRHHGTDTRQHYRIATITVAIIVIFARTVTAPPSNAVTERCRQPPSFLPPCFIIAFVCITASIVHTVVASTRASVIPAMRSSVLAPPPVASPPSSALAPSWLPPSMLARPRRRDHSLRPRHRRVRLHVVAAIATFGESSSSPALGPRPSSALSFHQCLHRHQ